MTEAEELELVPGFDVCERCNQQHLTHWRNKLSCTAHRSKRDELGRLIPCQGYRLPGLEVCKTHGGKSKRAQEKARRAAAEVADRRDLERAAKIFGVPRQIDPAEGLIEAYWRSAGIVAQMEMMVAKINVDDLTWGIVSETEKTTVAPTLGVIDVGTGEAFNQPEVETEKRVTRAPRQPLLVKMFNEERDRFERLGMEIIRLNLEARRDAYVRNQVDVFTTIIDRLGLSDEQRRQLAAALRELNAGARTLAIEGRATT